MLSKSLSTSEKFAALVSLAPDLYEFCHALYPLLIPHTDDFGRLQGDPFTVKHVCYPASPRNLAEFAAALQQMHDVELIIWYDVAGKKYVQIVKFDEHQTGLHKRTRSQFPRVPGTSGNVPEKPGQEKGTKEKRTEENGREENKRSRPQTGSGVMAGGLPREHLTHAACDPAFSRCVPDAVHRKLVALLAPKYGGDREQATAALQGWYPTVWQTLAADFVMGDAFRFWQGRFDASFASTDAGAKKPHELSSNVPSADKTAAYLKHQRERR